MSSFIRPASPSTAHLTSSLRGCSVIIPVILLRRPASFRSYATHHSLPNNRQSSAKNRQMIARANDGRVPWKNLSPGEKAARGTQQSFNFAIIIVGVVALAFTSKELYYYMFAPGNKVTTYNRVSDRVKADERCQELLGRGSQIRTHGEPTWNKWAMDRPIASTVTEDPDGTKHLLMHFYAEGPLNSGTVRLHMIKKPGGEYEYKYLCLDVKGHERIYLENADAKKRETIKSPMAKLTKILGF